MKKAKNKTVEVFMDGVDWQHEIGCASGGNTVYPSLEDILKSGRCVEECGVVKVKAQLVEWVQEQNWNKTKYITASPEEIEKDPDLQRLECFMVHLKYLEERVEGQKNRIEALKQKIANKPKV